MALQSGQLYRKPIGFSEFLSLATMAFVAIVVVEMTTGRVGLPGAIAATAVAIITGVPLWRTRPWVRVDTSHVHFQNRLPRPRRADRSRIAAVCGSSRGPVLVLKNGDAVRLAGLPAVGVERDLAVLLDVPTQHMGNHIWAQLSHTHGRPIEQQWEAAATALTLAILVSVVSATVFVAGRNTPPDRESEGVHLSPATVELSADRFYGIWPLRPNLFEAALGDTEGRELEEVTITPPGNNRPLFVERMTHGTGETVGRFRTSEGGPYTIVADRAGPTPADCIIGTNCIAGINDAFPDFSIGEDPRSRPTQRSGFYIFVAGAGCVGALVSAVRLRRLRPLLPSIVDVGE